MTILREIREACGRVASEARHVRIDAAGLAELVGLLASNPPPAPVLDPAHHALSDPEQTLAYVVTLDAINFGSGWFPVLQKRPGCSGYFTIATALKERFASRGAWTAQELSAIETGVCAETFGQRADGPSRELMEHFARALRDLGHLLASRFEGRFDVLVAAAGGHAARLVEILAEMPLYRDVSHHGGRPVPFYKRAQLTASDLHAAFEGEGPGEFADLDQLTIFADNLVPHVLRRLGVLRYAPDLGARIDAERRLRAGSEEEVEIRACALHAVESCVTELRARGRSASAQRLDCWLWNRGQAPDMKAHPRHRARSVYY